MKFTTISSLVAACTVVVLCRADTGDQTEKLEKSAERSVPYSSPRVRNAYFSEHFDNAAEFNRKWVVSKAQKPDVSEDLAQYNGKWELLPLEKFPLKGDTGLVLTTESRHAAIAAKFDKPFVFDSKKKFIVQYVVTFQKTVDCGGAYIKLLTDGSLSNLSLFNDKTPYTIMFGPDKCGGVSKMHFIIRHKNPINGEIIEKHCTKLKVDDLMYKDQEPYLLKLVIEPNNNFAVYVNDEQQYQGNLLSDDTFEPPINPPKEVLDEKDTKPENWDDRAKIPDPNAVKPEEWDEEEPAEIPDANAVKPEGWLDDEPPAIPDKDAVKPQDWDEEMDGEWAPPLIDNPVCKTAPGCGPWTQPLIPNPKFKGKWKAPLIDNPDFQGKWTPKKIPNPNYFFDDTPLKSSPIGYVGFELWSLVNNMYFDDILVTDSEAVSKDWTERTWGLKKKSIAAESITLKGRILKALNFSPGWWLIYGLYCAIPISIFVLYMKNVIRKVTYYKLFLEYTNNYPWLWAVYILVLALVVGIIGACCMRKRKNKDDFERESLHKKTDDYQQEDEAEEDEAAFEETTRGDEKNVDGDVESDPDEKNSKPSDDEQEDGDDVAENGEKNEIPPQSSPRKRRPRRD